MHVKAKWMKNIAQTINLESEENNNNKQNNKIEIKHSFSSSEEISLIIIIKKIKSIIKVNQFYLVSTFEKNYVFIFFLIHQINFINPLSVINYNQ